MLLQLWNSFLEELKTTKQKITYTNVMEDLFKKKKLYKIILIKRFHFPEMVFNALEWEEISSYWQKNKNKLGEQIIVCAK